MRRQQESPDKGKDSGGRPADGGVNGASERRRGHRWFAVFWDWAVRFEAPAMRRARGKTMAGLSGRVLEIGCGNGANFSYYPEGVTEIVATDPDPFMVERAQRAAATSDRKITVAEAPAEALPFDDASFDAAVSTLTLCTVANPAVALGELHRILRPGGELRFFEHVRYRGSFGGFWQDLITPAWRWCGAGCHPNRDTAAAIEEAGFAIRKLHYRKLIPPIPPMVFVRPSIRGAAVRPTV